MSQVIWRSIIIIFVQVSSSHGVSVSEIIFLLIWLWTYFPSDFFVILISFDALELLFFPVSTSINRKKLLMRSLQVSQHTDILQTQRRFHLFCYSTKFQHLHNTSYFQELTQNTHTHTKIPITFKHRTWTPFPTSQPPHKILSVRGASSHTSQEIQRAWRNT